MRGFLFLSIRFWVKVNGKHRPVRVVVKAIAIGAGGLGFNYRADQIGHIVDNSLPLHECLFGARSCAASALLNRGDGPNHSLQATAKYHECITKVIFLTFDGTSKLIKV